MVLFKSSSAANAYERAIGWKATTPLREGLAQHWHWANAAAAKAPSR